MFPFDRPSIYVNGGKGYIDIYTFEPGTFSDDTLLYKLVAQIEPHCDVHEVRGVTGLKKAQVRVNNYRKAIEKGLIAPQRLVPPPHRAPPQLFRSCEMPPRRLKNTLDRLAREMRESMPPADAVVP